MIYNVVKNIENEFKAWIKRNYKYLLVILLYIFYQSNFILALISTLGINISKIPKTPRIGIFIINDLIYVIILILMFKNDIKKGLKDLKENFINRSLISLKAWIAGCVLMIISSFLISLVLKQEVSTNETLVRESIKLAPLYMLFTCSIVAPLFEEMVFRKSLYGLIKYKWLFILVSGLGFGLLHVLGSYSNPIEFLYIIPYGSMGCCFAYLLTKTSNITLPILIHMIHNTILVLVQIYGGLRWKPILKKRKEK